MSDADARVARFVDAVKDDPRVLGVAVLMAPHDVLHVLVVCTWDGGVSLVDETPGLGAILVPGDSRIEELNRFEQAPNARSGAHWRGLGIDGRAVALSLSRIGELAPSFAGRRARVVHDPRGFIQHWIDASTSRESTPISTVGFERSPLLAAADAMRQAPIKGPHNAYLGESRDDRLRSTRKALRLDNPAEAALATRLDEYLSATPQSAAGLRLSRLDDFLRIADDEGFKGDRVLFGEAVNRLRDLAKREPVFDHGFLVPTFDAVEAAFALGEAVGGCKPPLVPGVYVGVGVTPADALEFWAAPFVRVATSSVACVDDTGERDVVLRTAGRDPMIAALTSSIDAAWERLPALIDRARDAATESVDPAPVLASLHLPRSFVERAKRRGAEVLMCSRLTVALALCAAGEDASPLVARKFGLAAGRALANR